MAQIGKMEVQSEIKSPAERFFEIFSSKPYLLPKICPGLIKDVEIINGDWKSVGSIKQWTYVEGNFNSYKETVEAIEDENKAITFKIVDGDISKYYKTLKATLQVTGKGDQRGSLVKWTIEYEKHNENLPAPIAYPQLVSVLDKTIDAYLTNSA